MSDFAALISENEALRKQLRIATDRIVELEDENDLLAEHNGRLQAETAALESKFKAISSGVNMAKDDSCTYIHDLKSVGESIPFASATVCENTKFHQTPMSLTASDDDAIINPCGTCNVISIGLLPSLNIVLCAGVDQKLHAYHNNQEVLAFKFHAPIIDICVYDRCDYEDKHACNGDDVSNKSRGGLIACSMMDGSHALIDTFWDETHLNMLLVREDSVNPNPVVQIQLELAYNPEEDVCDENSVLIRQTVRYIKTHSKYVHMIRFDRRAGPFPMNSPNLTLATCSYDGYVHIYDIKLASFDMEFTHRFRFQTMPECIEFARCGSLSSLGDGSPDDQVLYLIVAVRESCFLKYINFSAFVAEASGCVYPLSYEEVNQCCTNVTNVSLNENNWDFHISFTPLYINTSPDGKYLMVSTNHSFHYCYIIGSNKRVAVFNGMVCNDYSKPRTCWYGSRSQYFLANSDSGEVMIFSLLDTNRAHVLRSPHKGVVKELCYNADTQEVLVLSKHAQKHVLQLYKNTM